MSALSLQSCPTLCHSMDGSLPGSSVHGILQERILEWGSHSLLSGIFCFLYWQAHSLPLVPPGKPKWDNLLLFSHSVVADSLLPHGQQAACQASLSFTISQSLLSFMSIELVMPSNHLVLCRPLLLLWVFPSIRVFSDELALCISWPQYWSFSFSISPSMNIQNWFPLGLTGLILHTKALTRVFSNTTVQKHQFYAAQLSLWSNSHIHTWLLENNSFDCMDLWQSNVSAF